MCGGRFVHLPHSTPHRSIDSSISGMARKKTSLYSKLLMQFFMFRCCVFTFSANTHSHVHQHRQYSPTQLFFFHFAFFCPWCKFILFVPRARRSSTRWWWNGYTVWFGRLCVILIFYVCYSLLPADVAGMGERVGREKSAFCLCAEFLAWWWWFVSGGGRNKLWSDWMNQL